MAVLRREIPWIDERAMLYFQNVLDHQLRLSDQIDAARELLGNAVDAHLATMSNRVNDIMKKMTSWGAILLGATLIAGIYGMNFRHMPELNSRFGYPLALASMLLMTIGLVAYFRRKKWL
jgi:magnesium transporter